MPSSRAMRVPPRAEVPQSRHPDDGGGGRWRLGRGGMQPSRRSRRRVPGRVCPGLEDHTMAWFGSPYRTRLRLKESRSEPRSRGLSIGLFLEVPGGSSEGRGAGGSPGQEVRGPSQGPCAWVSREVGAPGSACRHSPWACTLPCVLHRLGHRGGQRGEGFCGSGPPLATCQVLVTQQSRGSFLSREPGTSTLRLTPHSPIICLVAHFSSFHTLTNFPLTHSGPGP